MSTAYRLSAIHYLSNDIMRNLRYIGASKCSIDLSTWKNRFLVSSSYWAWREQALRWPPQATPIKREQNKRQLPPAFPRIIEQMWANENGDVFGWLCNEVEAATLYKQTLTCIVHINSYQLKRIHDGTLVFLQRKLPSTK